MNTLQIINKRISLCPNIKMMSYQTITLFDALNSIRIGKYKDIIENIRTLYTKGSPKYRSHKRRLPAYVFSGILYDTRYKFDISGYTSLFVVDIDKLDSIEDIKHSLKCDPYIVALWTSPSGVGLKALFFIEYQSHVQNAQWILHEYCAFPQIKQYLSTQYNIQIDNSGSDITRLCFVSYDPDIFLKKEFTPFSVNCNLSENRIQQIRQNYYNRKSIRHAINEMRRISNLIHKHRTNNTIIINDDK